MDENRLLYRLSLKSDDAGKRLPFILDSLLSVHFSSHFLLPRLPLGFFLLTSPLQILHEKHP